MATYQIRNLFCLQCDRSVRARNRIVDGVEQEGKCPSCNHELIQRPSLNLMLPTMANGGTGILNTDGIIPHKMGGVFLWNDGAVRDLFGFPPADGE